MVAVDLLKGAGVGVRVGMGLPGPFSVSVGLGYRRGRSSAPRPETKTEIRDRGLTAAWQLLGSRSFLESKGLDAGTVAREGRGHLAERYWRATVRHFGSTRDGYAAAAGAIQRELKRHRKIDKGVLKEAQAERKALLREADEIAKQQRAQERAARDAAKQAQRAERETAKAAQKLAQKNARAAQREAATESGARAAAPIVSRLDAATEKLGARNDGDEAKLAELRADGAEQSQARSAAAAQREQVLSGTQLEAGAGDRDEVLFQAEGHGNVVQLTDSELRMYATNRMARIALTGTTWENVCIPLDEVAEMMWKDPGALTNGSLTIVSAEGSRHQLHFLRKHRDRYQELYDLLSDTTWREVHDDDPEEDPDLELPPEGTFAAVVDDE